MKPKTLIITLIVTSSLLSFEVGHFTQQRRHDVNNNFCVLDTAIVQFMNQQLAGVTKKDVLRDPRRWEVYRNQDVDFVTTIAGISPCKIALHIPPDPLATP